MKRGCSWALLAAAILLTVKACWEARHQLTVLNRWTAVTGTLLRREVPREHDADGYLYFQMKGTFRYPVDGKERESVARSLFGSTNFGWVAPRVLAYRVKEQYPIRYNPANPNVFEFGAGYNWLYFRTPLLYLTAAAACLLLRLAFLRVNRDPARCTQCRQTVLSFYSYCPDCGESISRA